MKTLFIIIALLNVTLMTNFTLADGQYCEWLGNAAGIVAQNRDNGLEEYDLIKNYLHQNQSYQEQKTILSLIDRVYQLEKSRNPAEIAYIEKLRCEVALASLSIPLEQERKLETIQ